ncbi:DUF5753 domain-containing protein [Embleya sp. NPDC001921]
MPARPLGANSKLVTARRTLGLHSQAGFADAFEEHALVMGMRPAVSVRQIRRWESADPPYPTPDYRRVLEDLFGRPLAALGFVAPDEPNGDHMDAGWRDILSDVPERLHRLIRLESTTLSLRSYQTAFIPGQLQTPDYALAAILMHDPTLSMTAAYERQRLRMDRVQRLLAAQVPAWFIVAEPALYQPNGSPQVLADQLGHLVKVTSEHPQVRLQVLPTGAPFAVSAPCLILEPKRGRYVASRQRPISAFTPSICAWDACLMLVSMASFKPPVKVSNDAMSKEPRRADSSMNSIAASRMRAQDASSSRAMSALPSCRRAVVRVAPKS